MKMFIAIIALLWFSLAMAFAGEYQIVPQAAVPLYTYNVNPQVISSYQQYKQQAETTEIELTDEVIELIARRVRGEAKPVASDTTGSSSVAAVLKSRCGGCHTSGKNPKGNFVMFRRVVSSGRTDDLIKSLPYQDILDRITSEDPSTIMPPPQSAKLTAKEVDELKKWVESKGAE